MNLAGNYVPITAFLLTWAAKTTVLLGAGWLASLFLRAHSAALRHRVWAIAIVSSLAVPLVSLVIPAWHVISRPAVVMQAVSQTTLVVDSAPLPASTVQPKRGIDTERSIAAGLFVWVLGAMLVSLKLLAGLARLRRVSAYSIAASKHACTVMDELRGLFGIRRRVCLLESPSATMMPMTWGVFRLHIVLPSGASGWDAERRRVVLSHELAHVSRNDWLVQFCAELLRGCFWFQPLAWIAARRLRQESERACDDAVLNSGITAPEYASQLLALAQTLKTPNGRFLLALAIARPSNLERRFAAMLNSSIRRTPLSRKINLIAISLSACLLLPLAALALSAESSPQLVSLASTAPPADAVRSSSPAAPASTDIGAQAAPRIFLAAADQLPPGSGRATFVQTCSTCHAPQDVIGKHLDSQGWTDVLNRMIQLGATGTDKDFATILDYLTTNFGPKPAGATAHLRTDETKAESAGAVANGTQRSAGSAQTAQNAAVASISGSVGDPSGAMIPRATVTLTDVATGAKQQISADPAGEFSFSNLIPDGYELSIAQPGFQIFRETIQLNAGEQVKLPEVLLRVGAISQEVTITASRTAAAGARIPAASTVPVQACSAQTTHAAQLAPRSPMQGSGPGPVRIRVGGMVEMARLIQQSLPIYPESARASGAQGTVVLNAVIGKDGSPLSLCAVNGQIDPALAQSAIDAVSQWRYSPVLLNGEPVEVVTEISVVYTLTN
jgi:TonB family protein